MDLLSVSPKTNTTTFIISAYNFETVCLALISGIKAFCTILTRIYSVFSQPLMTTFTGAAVLTTNMCARRNKHLS